jgi:hypothetical protein
MTDRDDWRRRGQESYLQGVTLVFRRYRRYRENPAWDHDHCDFCWAKFADDDYPDHLHEGYAATDENYWICPDCCRDFRDRFHRRVIGPR